MSTNYSAAQLAAMQPIVVAAMRKGYGARGANQIAMCYVAHTPTLKA